MKKIQIPYKPSVELLSYLTNCISDNKAKKIQEAIQFRTKHITVVLEDLYQPHNTNAILRSADCFGLSDVHLIENYYRFTENYAIGRGSFQWLDLHHYSEKDNNTVDCLTHLKSQGYKIIGTTPHTNDVNIEDLEINSKIALVLGTEKKGMTKNAMDLCDGFVKIPMVGFTESLNVSVCAAICLHSLTTRLRKSDIAWQLTEEEKLITMIEWTNGIIGAEDRIVERFLNEKE